MRKRNDVCAVRTIRWRLMMSGRELVWLMVVMVLCVSCSSRRFGFREVVRVDKCVGASFQPQGDAVAMETSGPAGFSPHAQSGSIEIVQDLKSQSLGLTSAQITSRTEVQIPPDSLSQADPGLFKTGNAMLAMGSTFTIGSFAFSNFQTATLLANPILITILTVGISLIVAGIILKRRSGVRVRRVKANSEEYLIDHRQRRKVGFGFMVAALVMGGICFLLIRLGGLKLSSDITGEVLAFHLIVSASLFVAGLALVVPQRSRQLVKR